MLEVSYISLCHVQNQADSLLLYHGSWRCYDNSRYSKSHNKTGVKSDKIWPRYPTLHLHTGHWNRILANAHTRTFALCTERSCTSMYVYIGFKTFFYLVRHLDSIASYLPTGLHLGFFRSWPFFIPSIQLFFGLPRALFCFLVFCMGVKLGRSHWVKNVGWGCLRIGCWGEYFGLRVTR